MNTSHEPKISVVILSWNTKRLTLQCIESVEEELKDTPHETIVIDNASEDGSAEAIERKFPGIKLVKNKENKKFAGGHNQGFRMAKGKYHCLLGSDTVVLRGGLKKLVEYLDEHKNVDVVAPQLLSPPSGASISRRPRTKPSAFTGSPTLKDDMKILLSCRKLPTPWILFKHGLYILFARKINQKSKFFGDYRMTWWDHNSEMEVEQPEATALVFRREAGETLGEVFDEEFPIFFNDVDLAFRWKKAGKKTVFVPGAKVIHYGGQSVQKLSKEKLYELRRCLLRLYAKHYVQIYWLPFRLLLNVATYFWVIWRNALGGKPNVYVTDTGKNGSKRK